MKSIDCINITLSRKVFDILTDVSKILSVSPENVASIILETIFSEESNEGTIHPSDRRLFRKKANIPCVVKFSDSSNNIMYKSAAIVDISLAGVGVVIRDSSKAFEHVYNNTHKFELVLLLDDDTIPTNYNCRICHSKRDTLLRLGGALLAQDLSTFEKFFRFFMRAETLTPA